MRKNKTGSSLDHLLQLAENTRAKSISWSRGYSIDRKILEFAQKNKKLKYREMRDILSLITKSDKQERDFIKEAEKYLPKGKKYSWVLLSIHSSTDSHRPILSPQAIESEELKYNISELKTILETIPEVQKKYESFKETFYKRTEVIEPICAWIDTLFHEGILEEKIISYKKLLQEKRPTNVSREIISNFVEPQKAEIIKTEGELPILTVGEREALQFILSKSTNMNEHEKTIKELLLAGKQENIEKDGLLVVFTAHEALRSGYGAETLSGWHYENLGENLQTLLEKKRKLLIKTNKGDLEFSGSLINSLNMRFTPKDSRGNLGTTQEYIAVQISKDILNLHNQQYASYPPNHFLLMRETPPKTNLDATEVTFFDILWSERPINKNKSRILRRRKNLFIEMVGGKETIKNRNKNRVAERIEGSYVPKAKNMGLLKCFTIETNKNGEEIYVFEYEDHNKTVQLTGTREKPDNG